MPFAFAYAFAGGERSLGSGRGLDRRLRLPTGHFNDLKSIVMSQVSFVNSINTSRGGSHVTYITDQVQDSESEKAWEGGERSAGEDRQAEERRLDMLGWLVLDL